MIDEHKEISNPSYMEYFIEQGGDEFVRSLYDK